MVSSLAEKSSGRRTGFGSDSPTIENERLSNHVLEKESLSLEEELSNFRFWASIVFGSWYLVGVSGYFR